MRRYNLKTRAHSNHKSKKKRIEQIMDRHILTRSPIASKYKRAVNGLELQTVPTLSDQFGPITPASNYACDNSRESRNKLYRNLFGSEIVNSNDLEARKKSGSVSESISTGSSFLRFEAESNDSRKSSRASPSSLFIAPVLYGGVDGTKISKRKIVNTPIKILDAPGLDDDFYLNLVDWEPKSNRVSVLLSGEEVYFWNAENLKGSAAEDSNASTNAQNRASLGRVKQIDKDTGCVIKWSSTKPDPLLAIGTKNGFVEIWDANRGIRIHNWTGHIGQRCGVLSWNTEGGLSSGGRDHRIVHYDLRVPRGIVSSYDTAHTQEVCGLKYDQHGSGLLASGGNDNQLLVWDRRKDQFEPLLELNQHVAAVKAIDWSPHQVGLLASGGGTADRTIRFWNTKLPASAQYCARSPIDGIDSVPINQSTIFSASKPIQASSQVCTLAWSPLVAGEILSTHGFSEHNLSLWSYPSGRCIGTLDGHNQRVLYQAVGPDGSTVVTGSGDETLRFWNVFRRPAASEHRSLKRTAFSYPNNDQNIDSVLMASR